MYYRSVALPEMLIFKYFPKITGCIFKPLFCGTADHLKGFFDKNKQYTKGPQLVDWMWTQHSILGN